MTRYDRLSQLVRKLKPKHIVEIGTWDGRRAIELMAVTDAYYTGFDLFEEANSDTDEKELNVKEHCDIVEVGKSIELAGFSKFVLVRGNTNKTLWETKVEPFDFCFIDGGHSVETIQNDYEWASQNIEPGGTIILDDYYTPEKVGFGCNFLEDKGTVLPYKDRVEGGHVSLLRVDA